MNIYSILDKKLKNNDKNLIYHILSFIDYKKCPFCYQYNDKITFESVFFNNCIEKLLICYNCHKNLEYCDNCKTKHKPKLMTYSTYTNKLVCYPCMKYYERSYS